VTNLQRFKLIQEVQKAIIFILSPLNFLDLEAVKIFIFVIVVITQIVVIPSWVIHMGMLTNIILKEEKQNWLVVIIFLVKDYEVFMLE